MRASDMRIVAAVMAIILIASFAGCGKQVGKSNDLVIVSNETAQPTARPTEMPLPDDYARISCTIDARDAYSSGALSEEVMTKLASTQGMLLNSARLTIKIEYKLEGIFKSIKGLVGGDIIINENAIFSIGGLENGMCSGRGRWIVKCNGERIDSGIDQIEIKDGDAFEFFYDINA